MAEPARLRFLETNLDHLRGLIRLTIEFHHYLTSGGAGASDQGNIRNYVCESVFAGIESFEYVRDDYGGLDGACGSKISWETVLPLPFKERFLAMFNEFSAETNFEDKCRLLLDLFKLQIVFAGICYD
jgi:hypothetical protein